MSTKLWMGGSLLLLTFCAGPLLAELRPGARPASYREADFPTSAMAADPPEQMPDQPPPEARPPPLTYTAEGRVDAPAARRAATIQVDSWAGLAFDPRDLHLGLGLVLYDGKRFRPTLQVGNGVIGLGAGLRIVPVLELTVGVSGLYEVKDSHWKPAVYVSMASW